MNGDHPNRKSNRRVIGLVIWIVLLCVFAIVMLLAEEHAYIYEEIAWSPNGGSIAVNIYNLHQSRETIFIYDVNKKTFVDILEATQFTLITNMRWSPDSNAIAFNGQIIGHDAHELFVVNLHTHDLLTITHDSASNFIRAFTWSSDSQHLAYIEQDTNDWRLALSSLYEQDTAKTLYRSATRFVPTVGWDAASDHIIFAIGHDVYRINTATSATEIIYSQETDIASFLHANISNQILIRSRPADANLYHMVHLESATITPILAADDVLTLQPVNWSPDDQYVVFSGYHAATSSYRLFVFDRNGQSVETITDLGLVGISWDNHDLRLAEGSATRETRLHPPTVIHHSVPRS